MAFHGVGITMLFSGIILLVIAFTNQVSEIAFFLLVLFGVKLIAIAIIFRDNLRLDKFTNK